jgi:hypothetical protein
MTSPRKAALMREWSKGCAPPSSYPEWHDWAAAQSFHGLRQARCKRCSMWCYPQELDELGVCRRSHNGREQP